MLKGVNMEIGVDGAYFFFASIDRVVDYRLSGKASVSTQRDALARVGLEEPLLLRHRLEDRQSFRPA